MKKLLLINFLIIAALCNIATAQIAIKKNDIKTFTTKTFTPNQQRAINYASPANNSGLTAQAYGIRAYDQERGAVQEFVSFYIDLSDTIVTIKDLSDYYIRAAAYANGYYYMANSQDGMCTYDLLAMDMETFDIDTIASYTIENYESAIIFSDMTFDSTTGNMYGIGYDLETAISEDDDNTLEVELALLKIDLTTGKMTNIGHQSFCNLVTIACDNKGELWGIDSNGKLWSIDKSNGMPLEVKGSSTDIPSTLQSMCFNPADGQLYWSGFSVKNNIGTGFFSKFDFSNDAITYHKIGNFNDNSEVIGLYIDSNPVAPNRPSAVTDLTITPAAAGAGSATLSWTNPSTLIDGTAINESISISIIRDDALVATLSNQVAGQKATYIDQNIASGLHEYRIICSNNAGEGKPAVVKNIFIGRDIPGQVQNLVAAKVADENKVIVSWEQPLSGKYGGWYDLASLTYSVTRMPDNKVIAEDITETTVTDTDFEISRGYTYEVIAKTTDGIGVPRSSNNVVVGTALSIPYSTSFATDTDVNAWTVIDGDNDGHEWFPASYKSTGQTFMKFAPDTKYNPETEANDWLITPPLALKAGVTYAMEYDMLLLGTIFPVDYNVTLGSEATIEAQSTIISSIDSLVIDMQFAPQKVTFKVNADGNYHLGFHIRNAVMVQITNVLVRELDAIDIAIEEVSCFNIGNVNREISFAITVKNEGADALEGYVINIVDENDNVITYTQNSPLLEPNQWRQHLTQWTPQEEGTITLYAVVEMEGDTTTSNNRSETFEIEIIEEGDWAHIKHNEAIMSYSPIQPSYKYSRSETLYYAEEISHRNIAFETGSWLIKGIIYYPYVFNNQDVENFNAQVFLTHSTDKEIEGPEASLALTQVFDGVVQPTPTSTSIYIPFDTPFIYTGGKNLIVHTRHSSKQTDYNLMFYGSRDDSGLWRMWYYSGNSSEFDLSRATFDTEIANISFLMVDNAAVKGTTTNTAPLAYLSHGNLFVAGEYDTIHIYSIDGCLHGTYDNSELYIPMHGYTAGIYIVEVISNGARSTSKIVVNR